MSGPFLITVFLRAPSEVLRLTSDRFFAIAHSTLPRSGFRRQVLLAPVGDERTLISVDRDDLGYARAMDTKAPRQFGLSSLAVRASVALMSARPVGRLWTCRGSPSGTEDLCDSRAADAHASRELGPACNLARVEHAPPLPNPLARVRSPSPGPRPRSRPTEIHQKCRKQVLT